METDPPPALKIEKSREYSTEAGEDIDSKTTKKMEKGGYVDDNICGGTKAETENMIGEVTDKDSDLFFLGTVAQIFAKVGMKPKVMVRIGETDDKFLHKLGGTVLGYNWYVRNDKIVFKLVVNLN